MSIIHVTLLLSICNNNLEKNTSRTNNKLTILYNEHFLDKTCQGHYSKEDI